MKEVWRLKNKNGDFRHICERFGVSLPMARLIVNRGYSSDEEIEGYLHPDFSMLPSWTLLKDIRKAVSLITKAIDNGEHIRIVGDYDVDGVTSTYLLMSAFEELGAYVSYRIPDRTLDGYGISHSIIEEAVNDGIDLIVTCDNGIAAKEQIAYARSCGMSVIVTDHHDIPEELPPADCIINPKQKDCEYPNKGICGALVAAKLCEGLFEAYGFGSFIEKNLDILALATICDVMELTGENRVVVKLGLEKLNRKSNIGLNALISECGLGEKRITAYHIGFVIGPCLNATGRLETADAGVELLRTGDAKEAKYLAGHLKELNEIRKEKTMKGVDKAVDIISNSAMSVDSVLVVYLSNCHESIAGIIAGRVREKYNRPAIVFTESAACEEILKGSGRSTENYNMFEGLSECKDILLKFGGHPMAAGLSISRESLDILRKRLNAGCKENLAALPKKVVIDIRMPLSISDCNFIEEMKLLEPTGKGNEKPVFADRDVTVRRISRFGREGSFLKLELIDSSGLPVTGKMFQRTGEFLEEFETVYGETEMNRAFSGDGSKKLHVVYYPDINEYNGIRSVQVNINSYMFPSGPQNADTASAEADRKPAGGVRNGTSGKSWDGAANGDYGKASAGDKTMLPKITVKEDDRCLIFCAGQQTELPFSVKKSDYIIAADEGYDYVCNLGLIPDELLGDFDSLDGAEEIKLGSSTAFTKYPVEKDDTDSAIAVKKAIGKGYRNLFLFGASGGKRIDHTIANISLLGYAADHGARAYMFDGESCLTVIKEEKAVFDGSCQGTLSVFAYGGRAEGVSIKNLKYEIAHAELIPEISLGVSNSFVGKEADVSVEKGKLLLVGNFLPENIKFQQQ